MKENDSSSVSRKEGACNSRTAEERMECFSSTGGNLTSTKIESQDVMFIVLQKNTRSLNSSRIDDLLFEGQDCKWDAILVSETWRSSEAETWETSQGHMVICAGK